MNVLLGAALAWLLLRSHTAMEAAAAASGLFVRCVLPGLLPYMAPALMLATRLPARAPGFLLTLMGWCGGSPTGARLLSLRRELPVGEQKRIAVSCATMSPMFLVGTVPQWTGIPASGACLLAASVLGGWLTGCFAGRRDGAASAAEPASAASPLSLGEAVHLSAHTLLLVCGTMMLFRTAAELAGELTAAWPAVSLLLTTLLEVTSGASALAVLPLPIPLRISLLAAATGFGGLAILLQNRTTYPSGLFSLREQLLWQTLHALLSGAIAYPLAYIFCT